MEVTKKEKDAMLAAFNEHVAGLNDYLTEYRNALLITLDEREFTKKWDLDFFKELGRDAFFLKVKEYHDHHKSIEMNMREVREILDKTRKK